MEVFLKKQTVPTAFFGGSFDPPHTGHLAVARGALNSGLCSHVIWAPAFAPPHKLDRRRAPFEHRMKMVGLLIKNEDSMSVSDIEAKIAKRPSYTIDILLELEAQNGSRPALLIGADSLLSLHTWHRCSELAENWQILTYPRKESPVTLEALLAHWPEKTAEKLFSGVIPGKFFEISSTEIRNSMEKNAFTGNIKCMTENIPEIGDYMTLHRLYGENSTKETDYERN